MLSWGFRRLPQADCRRSAHGLFFLSLQGLAEGLFPAVFPLSGVSYALSLHGLAEELFPAVFPPSGIFFFPEMQILTRLLNLGLNAAVVGASGL